MRGRFFVLDGVDGCGKSTQARALCERLARVRPQPPLHLREPGSTPAGERIREVVLDSKLALGAASQALLLAAARRQTLEELVRPALQQGRDVVCERFHPSTYAYQGIAGELGGELVLELLSAWAGRPEPDLVLLLDLPLERALERRAGSDRFESEDEAFQRRVSEGYRMYAEGVAGTVVVPADGDVERVAERVWKEVERAGL
ncbi:MAG: dTMP kinase [Planctomycetes bacterium]|nr:dTMP kinase [Planctomycetota bacterium]